MMGKVLEVGFVVAMLFSTVHLRSPVTYPFLYNHTLSMI